MNYNMNMNQTFQRILTQPCFKCKGEGKLYPFEGKRGIPSNCNVCNGGGVIDGSYSCCHWCKGEALVYPFDHRSGIPSDCYICSGKGYLPEALELCQVCRGEGKIYPFDGRRGIPSNCDKCLAKGGVPVNKKYVVSNTDYGYSNQGFSNMNSYNQNYNCNLNSNVNNTSNQPMIQTSYEPFTTNNKLSTLHNHTLTAVYRNFVCNVCDRNYGNILSNYCQTCDYDVCDSCAKIVTKSEKTSVHFHPLLPTQRLNEWCCNICRTSRSTGRVSWYCRNCDFDVCVFCYYY